MIHLPSKPILRSSEVHLAQIQQQIDSEPDFETKVNRAKSEWDNKRASVAKKAAFEEINTVLIGMCVDLTICNYCENNEATDIEHIFPKRLFPDKAFRWYNYLLACGKCNSHHKKDKFAIFDPVFSANNQNITPKRNVYIPPPSDDSVLINPRAENPLDFMELDLKTFEFIPRPSPDIISIRDEIRADYTIETLALNAREQLVKARQTAARDYLSNLNKYVQVKKAATIDELVEIIHEPECVDETQDFTIEQNLLLNALSRAIQQASHPTVWKELVKQRDTLQPQTKRLFNQAPEALFW